MEKGQSDDKKSCDNVALGLHYKHYGHSLQQFLIESNEPRCVSIGFKLKYMMINFYITSQSKLATTV